MHYLVCSREPGRQVKREPPGVRASIRWLRTLETWPSRKPEFQWLILHSSLCYRELFTTKEWTWQLVVQPLTAWGAQSGRSGCEPSRNLPSPSDYGIPSSALLSSLHIQGAMKQAVEGREGRTEHCRIRHEVYKETTSIYYLHAGTKAGSGHCLWEWPDVRLTERFQSYIREHVHRTTGSSQDDREGVMTTCI